MAAGRAFVTSGPILTLDVSGKGMGEELEVSRGDVVTVRATARSLFAMHRLEIVRNGRIVHTVDAGGDMKSIDTELELPIESSGWIAARVLGPPQHGAMDSYLFAHTNPVFVIAYGVFRQFERQVDRCLRTGQDARTGTAPPSRFPNRRQT